ncbi:MAG: cupin-like domain-containing protein [Alphaproteobacteria bacterium]|nr:cupin-like domain-containing protein [Alphaproteobacteria bacterium]MCB9796669.1 cupin-like domain-containing protein [Alphaproteobacteria bacterium]
MLGHADIPRPTRAAWNLTWLLRHVLGPGLADPLVGRWKARLDTQVTEALLARPAGRWREVPRRRDLSVDDFVREHRLRAEPVVLEGAAKGWPCMGWSPERFAQAYGADEVQLVPTGVEDLGKAAPSDAGRATLAELIAAMLEGRTDYVRFSPLLHDHPELLDELDRPWLRALAERWITGVSYQLFMGGPGSSTAIHSAIGSNLFVQAYGRKRWWIVPTSYTPVFRPPVKRSPFFYSGVDTERDNPGYPGFAHCDGWVTELEPGDVLYNPPFFWHQVRNPTTSIGVGFRWYSPASVWRSSPTQLLITLTATNPPPWVAGRNRTNFAKVYARMTDASVGEAGP